MATIYADKFAGTAGDAVAGASPSTPHGSEVYQSTLSEGGFVYKAGGGITSSGSALNFEVDIPLTGVSGGIGTYTTSVSCTNVADSPTIYLRADASGFTPTEVVGVVFNYNLNRVELLVISGGSVVTNTSQSFTLVTGTTYPVRIVLAATAVTVVVGSTTVYNATTIPSATTSRAYFRQQGPHAGAVTFGPASFYDPATPSTATIAGPSTGTAGSASTAFTVTLDVAAPTGGTAVALTGGSAGTFAGSGVSGSTLTIPSGQTVGTFTYTKTSAGAQAITPTATGVVFTPTSITYTASAPGTLSSAALTGPTAGTTGSPSGNFAVTLDAVAPTGGKAITLAGTGATFAGTNVSGSTLTIPAGQTVGNFTVTRSADGTTTVSITASGLTITGSPIDYTSSATGTNILYLTAVPDFPTGLVGGTTSGFGFKVSVNGGSYGSLVTSNIMAEEAPGNYSSVLSAPAGSLLKAKWYDGSGGISIDYAVQPAGGVNSGTDGATTAQVANIVATALAPLLDPLFGYPVARGGASGSITLAAGATAAMAGQYVVMLSGACKDQYRQLGTVNTSTGVTPVDTNWAGGTPASGDSYALFTSVASDPTSFVNALFATTNKLGDGSKTVQQTMTKWSGRLIGREDNTSIPGTVIFHKPDNSGEAFRQTYGGGSRSNPAPGSGL